MWPRFFPLPSTLILCAGIAGLGNIYMEKRDARPLVAQSDQPTPLQSTELESTEFERQFRSDVYYQAITERPLFSATRRPISIEPTEEVIANVIVETPVIVTPEPAPIEEEPVNFSIHGTMESNGKSFALIGLDGGPPEWIPENGLISGWTLREITAELAEFHKDTEVIRVYLYEDGR